MIIRGNIVMPEELLADGYLEIRDGRISSISTVSPGGPVTDCRGCWVMPGFIDLHLHGLGDCQILEAEGMERMARLETTYGTTAFLPTLPCNTARQYVDWLHEVDKAMACSDGAGIPGAHMEGPFIGFEGRGGMDPQYIRTPDPNEYEGYLASAALKLMTLSPELEGAEDLIVALTRRGVVASIGHSVAGKEAVDMAVAAGARHVCHLFDAMPPRLPANRGTYAVNLPELCMLRDELTLELIADGIHVDFDHIKFVKKACGIDRIIAVTDSMPGTGLADGVYDMSDGRKFTIKAGDAARLADDPTAIVGSILTMNRAVGNLLDYCGFSIVEAAMATASNAARCLGLDAELGSLAPGKAADIAVLDDSYNCRLTLVGGREAFSNL